MTNEHTASFYLQEAYYLARELEQLPEGALAVSYTHLIIISRLVQLW